MKSDTQTRARERERAESTCSCVASHNNPESWQVLESKNTILQIAPNKAVTKRTPANALDFHRFYFQTFLQLMQDVVLEKIVYMKKSFIKYCK